MCHVSRVMCDLSHVTCQVSHVSFFTLSYMKVAHFIILENYIKKNHCRSCESCALSTVHVRVALSEFYSPLPLETFNKVTIGAATKYRRENYESVHVDAGRPDDTLEMQGYRETTL